MTGGGPLKTETVSPRCSRLPSTSATYDQPEIPTHPHRPKVLILRLVQLVKFHARIGRVHLEIKGRGLHGLLLVAGEAGEAFGKGVGDEEVHKFSGLRVQLVEQS